MKFVDFGDLVEVTYDNDNIELISKEEAYKLGYKEQQKIEILYNNKIYSCRKFSALTKINYSTILALYNKGLHTGEEIIEAYNKIKSSKNETNITYKNEVFNCAQFSKLVQIHNSITLRYYNKGLHTGEEILEAYNKAKEYRRGRLITYQDKVYSISQFSKLIKVHDNTVRDYYNKGLRTGEEIIQAYNKAKAIKSNIGITYEGQVFTATQFSKLTNIDVHVICNYYSKGICTGEEILKTYNKRKAIKIMYQGKVYTGRQFSSLTGISSATVYKYYTQGMLTGEEMLIHYNSLNGKGKRRK